MSGQRGVLTSPFTEAEDEIVRQNYGKISASAIGKLLGRTRNSIIGRAHRIRIGVLQNVPKPISVPKVRVVKKREDKPVVKRTPRLPDRVTPVIKRIFVPTENRVATPLFVKLFDLKPNHCRWVMGEPSELTYCGSNKADGSSYCGAHHYESVRNK